MKNFTKTLMGVALFFLAASASFGQTKLTATSLSSAVTSSATSVTLGSVTGVTANTILFIEDGTSGGSGQYAGRPEAMFVVSVPASGTTVQVQRGYDQTPPAAHISVAGATNPSGPLFHVTGTNAITAWGSSTTVGPLGAGGSHTDVIGASFCVI